MRVWHHVLALAIPIFLVSQFSGPSNEPNIISGRTLCGPQTGSGRVCAEKEAEEGEEVVHGSDWRREWSENQQPSYLYRCVCWWCSAGNRKQLDFCVSVSVARTFSVLQFCLVSVFSSHHLIGLTFDSKPLFLYYLYSNMSFTTTDLILL